jgi:hypothetical protein
MEENQCGKGNSRSCSHKIPPYTQTESSLPPLVAIISTLIQSTPSKTHFSNILHLRVGLPSDLLPLRFPTKTYLTYQVNLLTSWIRGLLGKKTVKENVVKENVTEKTPMRHIGGIFRIRQYLVRPRSALLIYALPLWISYIVT